MFALLSRRQMICRDPRSRFTDASDAVPNAADVPGPSRRFSQKRSPPVHGNAARAAPLRRQAPPFWTASDLSSIQRGQLCAEAVAICDVGFLSFLERHEQLAGYIRS